MKNREWLNSLNDNDLARAIIFGAVIQELESNNKINFTVDFSWDNDIVTLFKQAEDDYREKESVINFEHYPDFAQEFLLRNDKEFKEKMLIKSKYLENVIDCKKVQYIENLDLFLDSAKRQYADMFEDIYICCDNINNLKHISKKYEKQSPQVLDLFFEEFWKIISIKRSKK